MLLANRDGLTGYFLALLIFQLQFRVLLLLVIILEESRFFLGWNDMIFVLARCDTIRLICRWDLMKLNRMANTTFYIVKVRCGSICSRHPDFVPHLLIFLLSRRLSVRDEHASLALSLQFGPNMLSGALTGEFNVTLDGLIGSHFLLQLFLHYGHRLLLPNQQVLTLLFLRLLLLELLLL